MRDGARQHSAVRRLPAQADGGSLREASLGHEFSLSGLDLTLWFIDRGLCAWADLLAAAAW